MYFSVITLTNAKGNILPSNSGEIVFLIFASLYTAFFLSYLIYSIGHTFKKLNKQSTRYLNQLASIKKYHIKSYSLLFRSLKILFLIDFCYPLLLHEMFVLYLLCLLDIYRRTRFLRAWRFRHRNISSISTMKVWKIDKNRLAVSIHYHETSKKKSWKMFSLNLLKESMWLSKAALHTQIPRYLLDRTDF